MIALQNRQFRLRARPKGEVKPTDFEILTVPVGTPASDEVLIKVRYLSVDPAMRGWMEDAESYVPPVNIGEVMRATGLGEVVASNDARFKPGDLVRGAPGVQDYAVLSASNLTKLDPTMGPLPRFLGALGVPGMTAYFGLLDIGQPQPGETVVVSGAAGAVGTIAGQIAKIKGCRVVGIAGGREKCRYLTDDLGFDAAIDYKADDLGRALRAACPKGIDVFFDNVGGEVLDIVLTQLAQKARVVLSGAISQYNDLEHTRGPKNYLHLLFKRARMEGLIVLDFAKRFPDGMRQVSQWISDGQLKAHEEVVDGLETFPETLLRLFHGKNLGKLCIKVSD
jgi:NADPH-dependent curcumin reductase